MDHGCFKKESRDDERAVAPHRRYLMVRIGESVAWLPACGFELKEYKGE